MTNPEIYQAIQDYLSDLYAEKPSTLEKALWRIKEREKIYDALMTYHYLCMEHRKEVKM